jgi:hypothetical protein
MSTPSKALGTVRELGGRGISAIGNRCQRTGEDTY